MGFDSRRKEAWVRCLDTLGIDAYLHSDTTHDD